MSTQQNQKKIYKEKSPDGKLFKNRALNRAKFIKNNEYYTLMKDVIQHVEVFKKEQYKDKIIYCPFSSDESNNFYKTIDFRDIHVRCSGISCKEFFNT